MRKEKYRVAIETHKFYDTVSMSVIGGMITVTATPFLLLDKLQHHQLYFLLFIIIFFVIIGLLIIYRKSAHYANIARNVSADLERNEELNIGVSDVLKNINKNGYQKYRAKKSIYRGIYGAVHLIFITLSFGLIFTSYIIYTNKVNKSLKEERVKTLEIKT